MIAIYDNARRILSLAKRVARFQRNRFRTNGSIFDEIYKNAVWGGARGQIYSGTGSEGRIAASYVESVLKFLKQTGCLTVVDIGCGDFRIGSKIASAIPRYIGVDASAVVIERNRKLHSDHKISFEVCDAERDPLPSADACLVRQVLQHLSNKSIKTILDRLLATYPYVIITEHLPAQNSFRAFNMDKPAGADIRAAHGSGVYVDMPPFTFSIHQVLLDVPLTKEQSYKTSYSPSDPNSWEHLKTFIVLGQPNT